MNRESTSAVTCLAIVLLLPSEPRAEDGSLALEDLSRYQLALRASPTSVRGASFRDLWEDGDRYRDRSVRVAGRVERRFRQPAVGQLPALTETWIVDELGNPFCLVGPTNTKDEPPARSSVRFEGTFLKLVTYQGQDGPRRAPLIVGPSGPTLLPVTSPPIAIPEHGTIDWTVGVVVGGFVVSILLLLHLRRPRPRPTAIGPAPEFHAAERGLPHAGA
jgi:hypothetical protein